MKLQLIRYYKDTAIVKGLLLMNGTTFCETRETNCKEGTRFHLPTGSYTCRCYASTLSPMTLKLCRSRGKTIISIGWNLLYQRQAGMICLGAADANEPPETRRLTRQQETFDAFTRKVYEAYAEDETFSLEVTERYGEPIV